MGALAHRSQSALAVATRRYLFLVRAGIARRNKDEGVQHAITVAALFFVWCHVLPPVDNGVLERAQQFVLWLHGVEGLCLAGLFLLHRRQHIKQIKDLDSLGLQTRKN